MKKGSIIVFIFSIIFLAQGLLWFTFIYQRGTKFELPKKRVTYEKIVENVKAVNDYVVQEYKQPTWWERFKAQAFVKVFLIIVVAELLAAVFYIILGIALFRRFVIARGILAFVVVFDMLFKLLVVFYQAKIVYPIRNLLEIPNLLIVHFMPDNSLHSVLAGYFTGIKLTQVDFLNYAVIYSVYLLSILYFFNRKDVKQLFKK